MRSTEAKSGEACCRNPIKEEEYSLMATQHISICPVLVGYGGYGLVNSELPLRLSESLYFEDVSEIVEKMTFDPLVPQFYSRSEADRLKQTRYALTRRFECADRDRHVMDEESAKLLYELYLGLKVIRPTAGRYQVLHCETGRPTPRLPRGSRNDYGTILCDCELLNTIRWKDLQELAAIATGILSTLKEARNPISQAVQSLEIGYRADFLNVRHLLWVIGLDALFTSIEWENRGSRVTVKRIVDFLGPDFPIYPEKPRLDYDLQAPPNISMPLNLALRDIYRLRNDFAHGTWPDKKWAGRVCRRSLDGSRDIYYAEVLSEAASAVMRACLKHILSDLKLVEMFNEKTKMNAYYASRGLLRKKRKQTEGCKPT